MAGVLRSWIALPVALLIAGCGVQEALEKGEKEVALFHKRLNGERYPDIYRATAPDFRKVTSREDFDRLLQAIRAKLGKVQSTKQVGWEANTVNGLSTVTLGMETKFERGEARESFTFTNESEQLEMLGYNIEAPALIYN